MCGHDESDAYRRAKAVYPPPGDINELASLSVYEFRRYVSEMHVRLVTFLRIEDLSTIGPAPTPRSMADLSIPCDTVTMLVATRQTPMLGAGHRPRAP